jgi:hypothetical protein
MTGIDTVIGLALILFCGLIIAGLLQMALE